MHHQAMESKKSTFTSLISLIFLNLLLLSAAIAEEKDPVVVWMDEANGYAIGGYDPVAYFTRRKAVVGSDEVQYDHKDIYWKFENVGNREAFKSYPQIYSPQFAGYDPFALAKGRTIRGLPTLWDIYQNKLYFFHNIIHRRLWVDDKDKIIRQAHDAWPKLSKNLLRRIKVK